MERKTVSNQMKGRKGEDMAYQYLNQRGYQLLDRNYRCPLGEIDLIMADGGTIVFVEVKFRTSYARGGGAEAVHYHKQQHLYRAAQWYIRQHRYEGRAFRMDIIEINGKELRHIPNAFDAG